MRCVSHLPLLWVLGACSSGGAGPSSADDDSYDAPARDDAAAPTRTPDGAVVVPTAEPSLDAPPNASVDEETELVITVPALGIRTFSVKGLPPGARFDATDGVLTFRPDFTQSGHYVVTVTGYAGGRPATFTKSVQFAIDVRDSITPPAPTVISNVAKAGFHELRLRQVTDTFLDSALNAGRTFDAKLAVPDALTEVASAPVQVWFHTFGGAPVVSASDFFMLAPHDPENTYWYGYGDAGPFPTSGSVQPYTARRVMHLLAWVMQAYPEADPNRVFARGDSMGGAGAMTIGMLHARHFAGILSTISQTVPRLHHVARIAQLSTYWGSPESNVDGVWDRLDLTRVLREVPEARDQFVSSKHGKDDRTILFRAAVAPSPLIGASFYATLEAEHIGHLSVWDEGGHGKLDPVLGAGWYDAGWNRMLDPRSRLRRDLPFPAFTHSSGNEDPGDDQGNGKVPWSERGGFAGVVTTGADTGWSGALAGALNRFLRWDVAGSEATRDRLTLPLYVVTSPGAAAPKAGYPTTGDLYTGSLPITVDVTPRRTGEFAPRAGELVRWSFGSASGTVLTNTDGSVTVPALPLGTEATSLQLERDPP